MPIHHFHLECRFKGANEHERWVRYFTVYRRDHVMAFVHQMVDRDRLFQELDWRCCHTTTEADHDPIEQEGVIETYPLQLPIIENE
jgi:hypothetical protein